MISFQSANDSDGPPRKYPYRMPAPVIAVSVPASNAQTLVPWAMSHGFAVEYTPDIAGFDRIPDHLKASRDIGVPERFHGRYYGWDIGHPDDTVSKAAMQIHRKTLKALQGCCPTVVTFHLHLCWDEPFDSEKAVDNLSILVEEGKRSGVTVCIENLRDGEASHPESILAWSERSGAKITLDIGHAISCPRVRRGELTVKDFIDLFANRLEEVHIYGYESDRHYPVTDVDQFTPIVNGLLQTGCSWWTIELSDPQEILSTRNILLTCMKEATAFHKRRSDYEIHLGSIMPTTDVATHRRYSQTTIA